jgi:hypothetical protein
LRNHDTITGIDTFNMIAKKLYLSVSCKIERGYDDSANKYYIREYRLKALISYHGGELVYRGRKEFEVIIDEQTYKSLTFNRFNQLDSNTLDKRECEFLESLGGDKEEYKKCMWDKSYSVTDPTEAIRILWYIYTSPNTCNVDWRAGYDKTWLKKVEVISELAEGPICFNSFERRFKIARALGKQLYHVIMREI